MNYIKYHSQWGEDKFLRTNAFSFAYKGFYVDVGAGDPVKFSNTYHFEKNGWKGICIDGDKRQIEKLREVRTCIIEEKIISDKDLKKCNYLNAQQPDLSKKADSKKGLLKSYTLDYVLKSYDVEKIDLLSIDVEGDEIEVLKGLSFDRYKPKIVIVEYLSPGKNIMPELIEFFYNLKNKNLIYRVKKETNSNLIYLLET